VFHRVNCVSTLLALHIEIALNHNTTPEDRLSTQGRIHNELKYLRNLSEFWSSFKWALRLFEVIVSRTGLALVAAKEPVFGPGVNVLSSEVVDPSRSADDDLSRPMDASNGFFQNNQFLSDGLPSQLLPDDAFNIGDTDYIFGSRVGRHTEDWLQDLFSNNLGNFDDFLASAV